MRARIARERKPTAEPGIGEIAPDQIADRIVGQRRTDEIGDLQDRNHDARCERELEEQLRGRSACGRERQLGHWGPSDQALK